MIIYLLTYFLGIMTGLIIVLLLLRIINRTVKLSKDVSSKTILLILLVIRSWLIIVNFSPSFPLENIDLSEIITKLNAVIYLIRDKIKSANKPKK